MRSAWLGTAALVLAASVVLNGAAAQAAPAARQPAAKKTLEAMRAMPVSDWVVVKFREGSAVRLRQGRLVGLAESEVGSLQAALRAAGVPVSEMRRLHARPESELDAERAAAEQESGRDLADLNNYFKVQVPPGTDVAALASRLDQLPFIEFAEPGPIPAPPPVDIAPTTPKFVSSQGYRGAPPSGIGATAALELKGGNGAGIRVVDMEYEWQLDHEDLALPPSRVITGGATPAASGFGTDHGTAVLGEIVGRKNAYGVTGIAPASVAYVAPSLTDEFGYDPARAISVATGLLRRGDVLVLEAQYWVCGYPFADDRYGPIEVLQSVFDAVSVATAKGIVVVAAAGNGNVDLDGANCGGLFDPNVRDSGAIIVGAGSSDGRARMSFSSYGSRVNVQGWGENVMTAGYGDAFTGGGDVRQFYTRFFSGTSSATPIVSGAVLAIQGVRKACGLPRLRPLQMRQVLVSTGSPQAPLPAGHIGPLPRIIPALRATDARSCVNTQLRSIQTAGLSD